MQILNRTTSVRLPSVMHVQLSEIAQRMRRHPSQLMREAITDFVSAYQRAATLESSPLEKRP